MPRSVKKTVVSIQIVEYFGYKQGYQVKMDGIKYPKERGHFYCASSPLHALESACRERAGMEP